MTAFLWLILTILAAITAPNGGSFDRWEDGSESVAICFRPDRPCIVLVLDAESRDIRLPLDD